MKHTLALSALAVLQGEMEILAWSYGKISHSLAVRETWHICQAVLELEPWPIVGLCCEDWCSVLLWKLGIEIREEG